jgi:hypothetical protein
MCSSISRASRSEAGGPDVLTYEDMIRIFGDIVGRHPAILPVPVLTPQLSSYWLNFVTSVPTNVARALIEGLAHDILASDDAIRALIPLELQPYRASAEAALALERDTPSGQRWTDGSMMFRRNRPDFSFYGKRLAREEIADAPVAAVWREVAAIGGANGYYYLDVLWRARGLIDELTGGTGLTRGRRDRQDVVVGDAIDFWRVIAVEPGRRLTLLAEMKLPGAAALDIELEPVAPARTRIRCTAHFHPAGARGLLYWHSLLPAHALLFSGLVAALRERAERAPAAA